MWTAAANTRICEFWKDVCPSVIMLLKRSNVMQRKTERYKIHCVSSNSDWFQWILCCLISTSFLFGVVTSEPHVSEKLNERKVTLSSVLIILRQILIVFALRTELLRRVERYELSGYTCRVICSMKDSNRKSLSDRYKGYFTDYDYQVWEVLSILITSMPQTAPVE